MDLEKMYTNLVETENIDEVRKEWKENNVTGYCYALLDKNSFSDIDKLSLVFIIKILSFVFDNSPEEPLVSNDMYENLYELNRNVNLMEIVGSTNLKGKKIAHHRYPDLRGTLDKIHFYYEKDKSKSEKNKKSMEAWFNSMLKTVASYKMIELVDLIEMDILAMPKYDGVSVIVETDENHICERALTRGDTENNEAVDLSHIFKGTDFSYLCEEYGIEGRCGIKNEVYMKYNAYEAYCKEYGHFNSPRAAAVSATNAQEYGPEVLKYLTIQPLRIQDSTGKITCIYDNSFTMKGLHYSQHMIENFKPCVNDIIALMKKEQIPIDGVVFVILNDDIQKIMGRKNAINKYEYAYKFPTDRFRTKIVDIEWSIGNLGTMTPVAKLEPIQCYGNTVESATLSSVTKLEELKLHRNDEVVIVYNIIPYLIKDDTCKESGLPKFKIPKKCPVCGHDTYVSGAFLRCSNIHCPSINVGKVINFIEKMRIANINDKTVNLFFNEGYLSDITDLYMLENHRASICTLNGFGPKKFQNIIDGINKRKKCSTGDMLGSLGIEGAARTTFKKILSIYNLSELIEMSIKHDYHLIAEMKGFGDNTAQKIVEGIADNLDTIKFLTKALVLTDTATDKTITFTGFRDKDFKEFLQNKGIEVSDSFNKQTELLVVYDLEKEESLPDDKKSKKYLKALKKGIPVVDVEAYKIDMGYVKEVGNLFAD